MMNLPKLQNFNFKGKRVLVRMDLDIPQDDDFRLRSELSIIKFLLNQKAEVILMGHLGRPRGRVVKELSLKPIAKKLKELSNFQFPISNFQFGDFAAFKLNENLILLENLRFNPGEEENDKNFAEKLANLGDFYVNEAFAASHREHASIVGIPKYLPHCVGFHFVEEVENLSKVLENPKRPLVFIIGGAKTETKLPVINSLFDRVDIFLLGGVVANTFMVAEPNHPKIIGQSVFDSRLLDEAKMILAGQKGKKIEYPGVGGIWKIKIPTNVVVAKKEGNSFSAVEEVDIGGKSGEVFDQEKMVVDIGSEMEKLYMMVIEQAGTVVLAGPMGLVEEERFNHGTKALLEAMAGSKAFKIVGGGDTIAALKKFGLFSKMDFVSLGGGAMLEFLAKGTLPGIEAISSQSSAIRQDYTEG